MEEQEVSYECVEEETKESLKKEFLEKYPKYKKVNTKQSLFQRTWPILLGVVILAVSVILILIGALHLSAAESSAYELLFYYGIPFAVIGALIIFITICVFIHRSRLKVKMEMCFAEFLRERGILYQPKVLLSNTLEMINSIKNNSRNK